MLSLNTLVKRGLSLAALALLAFVAACTPNEPKPAGEIFDELFMESLRESPEYMAYLGMRERYDEWNDYSQASFDRSVAMSKDQLARLREIDAEGLDKSEALSLTLYSQRLENGLADTQWRYHGYPVNQMFGVHSSIPSFLINQHLIANKAEAEAYIARVRAVPEVLSHVIEDLNIRADQGIIAPKFVFPHSIRDSQNIIAGIGDDAGAEQNPLVEDFKAKLDKLELDDSLRADLLAQLNQALAEQFAPAYRELIVTLQALGERSEGNFGVWSLPNGAAYYANALKRITTTDMTPDQIHQLGLDEVARIQDEMRGIMQQVGFEGDLQAFFEFMRSDPQFYLPDTDEGRQAYLDEAARVIDEMEGRLDELFYSKPKARVMIKAVEAFREKSAGRAFYQRPAEDGSRPGTYYANLYRMQDMPTYDLEALAYHEGIPGHHMQGTISQEQQGLPMFRRHGGYTAYSEGWGLYSEYIPKEMGLYSNPYSDFGRLSMEIWRACRLVVDTGLHHKRWTREEAIDYLTANTSSSVVANTKAIERYMIMPGQATAYKVGMLKILELREKARTALGDQFDIRGYHELVLSNGAVPLNVLETLVDDWVAETQG
ncbi:MAG: DUF885 domain-containing protein [Porticoccaceae bacterium]|jgi:uncharacterized protein (DUF885 family)|nr:DUF885 domain-containing protein [Porticoccaceae bacterium]